jgi:phosphoenolpyruvate synthase/pyruvate phosphate dikinase
MPTHIVPLEACTADDRGLVGGKALGLGSLLREGLQVPPGFVVTTDAYHESVVWPGLQSEVVRLLDRCTTDGDLVHASEAIRAMFERAEMADTVATEIALAYRDLGGGRPVPVAVRSSSTAEDLGQASFAGQQDTYLWIRGADEVVAAVRRCWGSLFTPQAIAYRAHFGIPTRGLAMAVVVQRMVDAVAAGVMITLDPLTGDPSQITIEASYGLGLAVVGGELTPDRFAVDKVTYEIRARAINDKPFAYHFDPDRREVVARDVPEHDRTLPALTDAEIVALARLGRAVERAHRRPQDIEWAIGPARNGEREIFLLQTRPETVWSQRRRAPIADPSEPILERMLRAMRQPLRLRDDGATSGPAVPAAEEEGASTPR